MNKEKNLFYEKRAIHFKDKLNSKKRQLKILALLRLFSFAALLTVLIGFTKQYLFFSITLSTCLLVFFFILIKIYSLRERQITFLQNLVTINENETKAVNFNFTSFNNGNEYINSEHDYTYDLDIFGDGSLFQCLNRTTTINGKKTLSNWLINSLNNEKEIILRQEAVKELSEKAEFRQKFNAAGLHAIESSEQFDTFNDWLKNPAFFLKKHFYPVIISLAPILSLSLLAFTFINPEFLSILLMYILMLLTIVGIFVKRNNKVHQNISTQYDFIQKTISLFQYIENEIFISSRLINLKNILFNESSNAKMSIRKLSKIVSAFDTRLNMFAGILLNGFLLWDIRCVIRLEKWKEKYSQVVPLWFDTIGEFEALMSIANFYFNYKKNLVFPELDTQLIFQAENLGHPLINENLRVNNNLQIKKKGNFIIVTGANMSGKSTLLRTIGVNFILAMIGAPVCATKFKFTPFHIFTSMRTNDSLQRNESYFYAELKRLKAMIDELKNGKQPFIILDEILKGTNSKDKQLGSQELLKKIIHLEGIGIIATHDLELAKMQNKFPDIIQNKSFEIEIDGENISFDYILRDGITKKMNALLLMEQMGLVERNEDISSNNNIKKKIDR